MSFTHIDQNGNAVMVDVGGKEATQRTAVAAGTITMREDCFAAVVQGRMKKGDVLGVAQVAGIMACKRTSDLIPLCHNINLTGVDLVFSLDADACAVTATCTVRCSGQTGVEMEALTGVSAALLTVYDMCKAMDKTMEIGAIRLLQKSGGKSGDFVNRRGEADA